MPALWPSIVRIMTTDAPEYSATFLGDRDPTEFERLGLFVPHAPKELTDCPECREDCEIRVLQDHLGNDVLFCICPACGPSRVAPSTLKRWSVYWEPLVERVVAALEIKGRMEPLVPGYLWNLGRKARREILFVRRCLEEHFKMLLPVLTKHPKAVIMTLNSGTAERLQILLSNRIFSLEDTTRFDPGSELVIDLEEIGAHFGPEEGETAKAMPRRTVRVAKIEKLVGELKEHYRRSKDHYYTAGDILPRPTQVDLARLTGLRQDDVSRCLHDRDAIILQHLWKHAEVLDVVLNTPSTR